MKTLRDEIDLSISEAVFQGQIIKLATLYGWKHYHTHDSRRSMKGFQDLVLVRGERLIFAEVKKQNGKTTPEQREWYEAIYNTAAEVYIWKPRDWTGINAVLKGVANGKT